MLIIREYIFEMNADKYGRVRVKRITSGAMREIIKRLPNYKMRTGYDVTLTCASVLCIDDQDKFIHAAQLSDMELEEFAEKLLANRIRVKSVNGVPVNELPRKEGESSVEYCGRVIVDEIGSYHDQMTSFVEKSGFLSAANEINRLSDIVRQSTNLSKFIGLTSAAENIRSALNDIGQISALETSAMKMYKEMEAQRKLVSQAIGNVKPQEFKSSPHYEDLRILTPLPNPIYDTNKKIEVLAAQVEIFTGTLTGHLTASAVALRDVAEHIEKGAESTRRQNYIMILLAVLAIIVPLITSYVGYSIGKSTKERNVAAPTVVAPMEAKPKSALKTKGPQLTKTPKNRSSKEQK